MHIEYEVRVLEIDVKEIKQKLESLGAKYIGEYNQKRYVYDFKPVQTGKWLRLRTNGKKTTLAIKEIKSSSIDGTFETEVEVSDFDDTCDILSKLGYEYRQYEENHRITYTLDDVEIDIDSWPLIPTYLEVEGNSEREVMKMIDKLGLTDKKVTPLDVTSIYNECYDIDVNSIKILKFDK